MGLAQSTLEIAPTKRRAVIKKICVIVMAGWPPTNDENCFVLW